MQRKIGSLFSGIGGLELGLERSGLGRVAWQCEIDPFCRDVLERHWPEAKRYGDITSLHAPSSVEVMCGGFPCQDVSLAGKNAGMENGTRSGLWAEYARLIGEVRPKIVVIENVPGLLQRGLRRVLADLASLGYDAEWAALSAADVGAPHLRRRIFIVATDPERVQLRPEPGWLERACRSYSPESVYDGEGGPVADAERVNRGAISASGNERDGHSAGREQGADRANDASARRDVADAESECGAALRMYGDASCDGADRERAGDTGAASACGITPDSDRERELQPSRSIDPQWRRASDGSWWPPVSSIRRVGDGIPNRAHGKRLKALGNAVVPQCAEVIGRAILDAIEAEIKGGE